MSLDLDCIATGQTTCAFSMGGQACGSDADCAWLVVPNCCCAYPLYVLDPSLAMPTCSGYGCSFGIARPE
jgi:hypothetical protein